MYEVLNPIAAHVASVVATWPPHEIRCSVMGSFANGLSGRGYAGRR
jgi:hypothetical protein